MLKKELSVFVEGSYEKKGKDTDNYHCSILKCDFVLIDQNSQKMKEHVDLSHSDISTENRVLFMTSTEIFDLLDAKMVEVVK